MSNAPWQCTSIRKMLHNTLLLSWNENQRVYTVTAPNNDGHSNVNDGNRMDNDCCNRQGWPHYDVATCQHMHPGTNVCLWLSLGTVEKSRPKMVKALLLKSQKHGSLHSP